MYIWFSVSTGEEKTSNWNFLVFSEVGVNSDLYYMVFGESLLNDGIAVVLYNMMITFAGLELVEKQEVSVFHVPECIGGLYIVTND